MRGRMKKLKIPIIQGSYYSIPLYDDIIPRSTVYILYYIYTSQGYTLNNILCSIYIHQ